MIRYLFKQRYSYVDLTVIGGFVIVISTNQWWWLIPMTSYLIIVSHLETKYNDNS